MNSRFTAAAQADLADAASWYRSREQGLDRRFLDEVSAVVERIERHPEVGPEIEGRIRRVLLRRFPYALFYIREPSEVVVIACLHGARDPATWRTRGAV